jgi:chromosome partitioning protein
VRRILVASSKGGCGKTTVTTNLAVCVARAGWRTVVLDCDRQGSSLDWVKRRGNTGIRVVNASSVASPTGGLWSLMIPPATDVVLVDTPAGVRGQPLSDLLRRCDTLIVPVLPSVIDLRATWGFLEELRRLPEVRNGALRVGLVANRVRERTLAARELKTRLAELNFPLLATVRDTQAYVLAAALGKGIFDFVTPQTLDHQADWQPILEWLQLGEVRAVEQRVQISA